MVSGCRWRLKKPVPDVRLKVIKGDWPEEVLEKMKLGDKFLWMPDDELRKMGVAPVVYIVELYSSQGRRRTVCMPHPGLGPAILSRG